MKHYFIVNPAAGQGKAQEIVSKAIEGKQDCKILATTGAGSAKALIGEALKEDGEKRFYACGGDGTVNEVASALIGKQNVSFSVYPCGSGNDFVKAFGGAEKFENIEALMQAKAKPIDAMEVSNGKDTYYCVNVCNFGFDAIVGKTANEVKEKGGKDPYGAGIKKAIFCGMKNKATIKADGEVLNPKGKFLLCTVANGKYVGGKFLCAPKSVADDGYMEVCLFDTICLFKFLSILDPYTNGEHLDGGKKFKNIVHYKRAKVIEINAPKEIDLCLDGEMITGKDVTIKTLEGALKLAMVD
jgi:diacylglycerol kinase (ATP)